MSQPAANLSPTAQAAIADVLNQSLAETVVATMLAQNFHWNVTGMAFSPLHDLFQVIYEDHFSAQDELAERIKAIDMHAEGQLGQILSRSKVSEADGHQTDVEMIRLMLDAQETLAATLSGTSALASQHGDRLTEDLATGRGRTHEKFAWMLRAHLKR